jgi:hypothetical protein
VSPLQTYLPRLKTILLRLGEKLTEAEIATLLADLGLAEDEEFVRVVTPLRWFLSSVLAHVSVCLCAGVCGCHHYPHLQHQSYVLIRTCFVRCVQAHCVCLCLIDTSPFLDAHVVHV